MYLIPRPYLCPHYGSQEDYSPHDPRTAPVSTDGPVCSNCWDIWLRNNHRPHEWIMQPVLTK